MFRVLSIHHLAVENHGGAPNASSELLRHVGGP